MFIHLGKIYNYVISLQCHRMGLKGGKDKIPALASLQQKVGLRQSMHGKRQPQLAG